MSDFYYHGTARAPFYGMTETEARKKIAQKGLGVAKGRPTTAKLPHDPSLKHKFGQKVPPLSPYSQKSGVVFKVPSGKKIQELVEDWNNPEKIRGGGKAKGGYTQRLSPKYVSGFVEDGVYKNIASDKEGFLKKLSKVGKLGGGIIGASSELIDPPKLNQGSEIYPTDMNPRDSVMHDDYGKGFFTLMFKKVVP